ncbi:MAG: DUF721 domain-containing protein [Pyrinomonadaceae bacterium]
MRDLFQLLPNILEQFDDSNEFQQAMVFGAWKKAAGRSLSDHTIPLKLREKRLTIGVADNTWKRHLEELSSQMIFKLNSMLRYTAVTFIEFVIDEQRFETTAGRLPDLNLSDSESRELAMKEISEPLKRSSRAIADEDLRRTFLLAAGGCLARKKRMGNVK